MVVETQIQLKLCSVQGKKQIDHLSVSHEFSIDYVSANNLSITYKLLFNHL